MKSNAARLVFPLACGTVVAPDCVLCLLSHRHIAYELYNCVPQYA